jgi:hypothetical protein
MVNVDSNLFQSSFSYIHLSNMDCVDIYQSVAIETLESDQSHYMIFVFIGELTNWPNKMFPETGPKSFKC